MAYKSCQTTGCSKRKDLNDVGKCPRCVEAIIKYQNKASDVPVFPCGTCTRECEEKSRSIMCNYCEKWFHSQCVDLDDESYDFMMKKLKSLKWFCNACDVKVDEAIEKCISLEKQTKSLQAGMVAMEQRIATVESKVAGTVHKEIHNAINERADIDRRKCNLVVYNFPEAIIPDEEGEKKTAWDTGVRRSADTEALSKLIADELHINMGSPNELKISNAIRLGKRLVDDKPRETPRPLKITFSDITVKREVLTKSKDLRSSTDNVVKRVFFNPDLTPEQRKKDKQLRDQMWDIREKQQKNVVIQKGKIVEVTWEVRKTRTPPKSNNSAGVSSNM